MERIPRGLEVCLLAAVLGVSGDTLTQERDRGVAPIPGGQHERGPRREGGNAESTRALFPFEFRSIDGTGNHPLRSDLGTTKIELLRLVEPAYGDGSNSPSGARRPNVRELSQALSTQNTSIPNTHNTNNMLWQWGQFLNHNINKTPTINPPKTFNIKIPTKNP